MSAPDVAQTDHINILSLQELAQLRARALQAIDTHPDQAREALAWVAEDCVHAYAVSDPWQRDKFLDIFGLPKPPQPVPAAKYRKAESPVPKA
jgi:hypothetical protein